MNIAPDSVVPYLCAIQQKVAILNINNVLFGLEVLVNDLSIYVCMYNVKKQQNKMHRLLFSKL